MDEWNLNRSTKEYKGGERAVERKEPVKDQMLAKSKVQKVDEFVPVVSG